MLVIRLFRVGKKNQPSFKIVVTPKRRPPRGGRFVEEVGFYNPLTKEKVLKKERIIYWISKGAKLSATVHNLLVKENVIEGKKIPLHKKPKEKEEGAEKVAEVVPKKEEAKVEETKEALSEKEQKEETKEAEAPKKEEAAQGVALDEPRPSADGREKKPEKADKA